MKKNMILHRPLCGLPQKELTTHVGVTRQAIIAIEHGKYVPSAALALKIAREFGKPVEEVFSQEGTD